LAALDRAQVYRLVWSDQDRRWECFDQDTAEPLVTRAAMGAPGGSRAAGEPTSAAPADRVPAPPDASPRHRAPGPARP